VPEGVVVDGLADETVDSMRMLCKKSR
jgi:hypothetical protein